MTVPLPPSSTSLMLIDCRSMQSICRIRTQRRRVAYRRLGRPCRRRRSGIQTGTCTVQIELRVLAAHLIGALRARAALNALKRHRPPQQQAVEEEARLA